MSRPMPRLFVIRHGETEWSLNGSVVSGLFDAGSISQVTENQVLRTLLKLTWNQEQRSLLHAFEEVKLLVIRRHTGRTDIALTPRGEEQVKEKAPVLVGEGKPIDPKNLCTVFVSPRQRAHRTFHLLFAHVDTPHHILTEKVREWDYGEYEGLLSSEIKAKRSDWSIWEHGCPGGESVDEMEKRVDGVIASVREYHRQYHEEGLNTRDVVIVAHGHLSRVLIARWIQFPLRLGTHFNVEPGGVAVLSYNHNSLFEPALNALNLFADLV